MKKNIQSREEALLRLIYLVVFFWLSIGEGHAAIRYVTLSGSGNGSSWASASNDLQAMINASAAADEIWVAKGTYLPIRKADNVTGTTTPGDRYNAFVLKADVKIYGGFAGIENTLAARNWLTNLTILSGDFNGNDAVSGSGSTLSITNNSENAYHVVIAADAVGTAVLDGFTVKGGNANSSSNITVNSKYVSLYYGGAMFNSSSSPNITNCSFTGNKAYNGGSIYNHSSSSPVITNCSFTGNYADHGGGAMFNSISSPPTIINCSFTGNESNSQGGGIVNDRCSPPITNCSFVGNNANFQGGGIFNVGASPVITNCSFMGNNASNGGGICNYTSSTNPQLRNSIIWGNTSPNGAGILETSNSITTISYSIVQNGATGINGNLNTDPLFKDAANGNLRLQCGSPAINAGNNSYIPGNITIDLDDNTRIQNTTIDMGAYEGAPMSASTALATATTSDTKIQAGSTYYGFCGSLIATVKSSGSSSISGGATAKVWIDAAQPAQYVKRHYQITPDNNAATATGTVTLYFTQQEFDAFNGQTPAPALLLPTGPGDATGIGNLLIEKRPGISSDGSGAPATYTGTPTIINPDDAKIVWSAFFGRWEVTFDVTGFSGFFVKTSQSALPVSFGGINAAIKNGTLTVNWQTLTETNNDHFEIEASQDGVNFTTIATVASKAEKGNSSSSLRYSWESNLSALATFSGVGIVLLILLLPVAHRYKKQLLMASVVLLITLISCSKRAAISIENPGGKYFIRIAQVDKDGGKTYSKIVSVVN